MRTHYDNLNVSENAPDEVIRAAHAALVFKHHPDRNPNTVESQKIVDSLDASYEAISTSSKRAEYNRHLNFMHGSKRHRSIRSPYVQSTIPNTPEAPKQDGIVLRVFTYIFSSFGRGLLFITVCFFVILAFQRDEPQDQVSSLSIPTAPSTTSQMTKPRWVRPSLSPIGTYWPTHAGYVSGYEIQAQGGLSSVTIDNSRNSSDVFLKLVWLAKMDAIPARMCYIPAHSKFTFSSIWPGIYDVRYRDLATGALSKTDEFILQERETSTGTNYSNITLTLYSVVNGNMEMEAIDESEF